MRLPETAKPAPGDCGKRASKKDCRARSISKKNTKNRAAVEEPFPITTPTGNQKTLAYLAFSQDRTLTRSAVAVGCALVWHCNSQTGRCDPSIERLAAETGYKRREVYRALEGLQKHRWIAWQRHRGKGYTNDYFINWPKATAFTQEWEKRAGWKEVVSSMTEKSVMQDITCVTDVTQTLEETLEGENDRSASSSLNRDDASRLGYQGVNGVEVVNPLSFLAKPKTLSSKIVVREKAQQRFDEDLRKRLRPEAYAEFVGRVDNVTLEKSIDAEIARRGQGVRVALEAMNGGGHD